jgi:hypothetical protein
MNSGMKPIICHVEILIALLVLSAFSLAPLSLSAQAQARRLILKDGSYQSVTKYEIQGDRVRYFSAERGEWEEIPKSLIDWDATDKFEQGRAQGKLAPEAVELDKQLEAERKAEEARSPQVAPGLRLPDEGGIFLLDTYQNEPQLAELQQSGGEVEKNKKSNILRSAINPLAGAKQTVELPGAHAKIQSHTAVPALYINIDTNGTTEASGALSSPGDSSPLPPAERFRIIRIEVKGGKRVAGSVKTAVTGKTKSEGRFVASTVTAMTGGWIKLTPTEPLAPGEYAVAEMLGKEGMNLYVWDFGVNPSAPANASTWKAEPVDKQAKPDPGNDLKKRPPDSPNW